MIWPAFLLGFAGSLHCIGMCGIIALSACSNQNNSAFTSITLYHIGKIITYILLGLLFGLFGEVSQMVSIQKWMSIISGILIIFIALKNSHVDQFLLQLFPRLSFTNKIQNKINFALELPSFIRPFAIGLINGLLPCGLVYIALAGALSSQSYLGGASFMLFFGIGTAPALIAIAMLGNTKIIKNQTLNHWSIKIILVLFGLYLIYRGVVVYLPSSLDFISALSNPVMCH